MTNIRPCFKEKMIAFLMILILNKIQCAREYSKETADLTV